METAAVNNEISVLLFSISTGAEKSVRFYLNTHKVREVLEWEPLTEVPDSLAPVIGVLDLRGVPVPVIDLSLKVLGTKQVPAVTHPRLIICETMGRLIAIKVPNVSRIRTIMNEDVHMPPQEVAQIGGGIVNGLFKKDQDGFIYQLDIEALLGSLTPVLEPEMNTGAEPLGKAASRPGQGLKVLIVEDSKTFQKQAARVFEKLGFSIVVADNGRAGLAALMDLQTSFDLIFTDIEMPVMNGLEMAKEIRAGSRYQAIPIIFSSSISNLVLIEEIKQSGLGEYVVKFEEKLVVALVLRVLDAKLKGASHG
ncbi:MAG TPA: hypothetical protein DCS07_08785 [Bdellovibrionales bacterium]|nr:MAG: hypothetical protein A2Z97_11640 [Bdellovibrionales bacterium GWB1_52_6]OFZ03919.1 MAG: hypothetical protein A2X97_16125 [Bdellovibrionales bacterium GWA1_52_35]OFZ37413.1 MAG: hypothetical protein A2070_12230 [Bdellovibrionales bacterium GWC1_52_8]HAR42705.1 hypothetical protein [Bdellovibrionales bacterium]HCM39639.1 hypothetical protein [Bdellovibrionales bacterium]